MKKAKKIMLMLVVCFMMVSLCSCSKGDNKETNELTPSITQEASVLTENEPSTTTETNTPEEIITPEAVITPELVITPDVVIEPNDESINETLLEITELLSEIIGTDREDAVEMINEYFGVDLNNTRVIYAESEKKGIVTWLHAYPVLLSKNNIRFNGIEIYSDQKDRHVRRIELICTNSSYTTEYIEDTPEFRDEIKKLNNDLNDVLRSTMGAPYDSGELVMDENSLYYYYRSSDSLLACVLIRDFTDPDENGLMCTSVIFVDDEIFLRS